MTAYEPGTVAVATVRGVPGVQVMRRHCLEDIFDWAHSRTDGLTGSRDGDVTDIRPLVVLDLPDPRGTLATLHDARSHMLLGQINDRRLVDLIDQIEAQTRPPKPAEPLGLGAVVEDAKGEWWVRAGMSHEGRLLDNWRLVSGAGVGDWQPWDRIDVARVLSEGVSA